MTDEPGDDPIEITARVPNRRGRITITVDIDPMDGAVAVDSKRRPSDQMEEPPAMLAGGRALPALLFATHGAKLAGRIGEDGYRRAKSTVRAAGMSWLEVDANPDPIRTIGAAARAKAGIVLLGGYDVLPGLRFDTLPVGLREQLGSNAAKESDSFIVWSDQRYADVDGDAMADVPISRIPDAGSADFLLACLTRGAPRTARRFGLHNVARPFAADVYLGLTGTEPLLLSAPIGSGQIRAADLDADALYVMLHGDWSDGTAFWGEQPGGFLKALGIADVPSSCNGVVFSGCCWGALIVNEQARRSGPVTSRAVADSLALTFLSAGAQAFIGCTGSHYSPQEPPYDYFGGPLHTAFWQRIAAGDAPAKALYSAKGLYINGMPHGRTDPSELAIEYKTLREFTCLGLGW